MKLIASTNLANGLLNENVPKGNYEALIFEFTGTAVALATVLASDLGRLRITRRGEDFCNIDFQDLLNINNYESGIDSTASAVGGAFNFTARYNFAFNGDLVNCARFDRGDNGLINCQFAPALVPKVSAGTLNVYAVIRKGVEKYQRHWFDFSQNQGATGSQLSPKLEQPNVNSIYFRTGADFGTVVIYKDNYALIHSNGPALVNNTAYKGHIEAGITFSYLELNPTHAPAEIQSDTIQFYLTSAVALGGVTTILYEQIFFDSQKTSQSAISYQQFKNSKIVKMPAVQQIQAVLSGGSASEIGNVRAPIIAND